MANFFVLLLQISSILVIAFQISSTRVRHLAPSSHGAIDQTTYCRSVEPHFSSSSIPSRTPNDVQCWTFPRKRTSASSSRITVTTTTTLYDSSSVHVTSDDSLLEEAAHNASLLIYNEALAFCRQKLGKAGRRVFGCTAEGSNADPFSTGNLVVDDVSIHNEAVYGPLLSKSLRGRREHLFREEIRRLLLESFEPSNVSVAQDYDAMKKEGENSTIGSLTDSIHTQILREAMQQAVIAHTRRADGRGGSVGNGCKVIRPLSIEVPVLPSVVHGSALFGRGETQVLVTTTLGSPRDTMPVLDPFQVFSNRESPDDTRIEPSHDLPVGSLRYLKSSGSEYIEADLNTRRIMADREQTGDSGTLKERRRGKFFGCISSEQ